MGVVCKHTCAKAHTGDAKFVVVGDFIEVEEHETFHGSLVAMFAQMTPYAIAGSVAFFVSGEVSGNGNEMGVLKRPDVAEQYVLLDISDEIWEEDFVWFLCVGALREVAAAVGRSANTDEKRATSMQGKLH